MRLLLTYSQTGAQKRANQAKKDMRAVHVTSHASSTEEVQSGVRLNARYAMDAFNLSARGAEPPVVLSSPVMNVMYNTHIQALLHSAHSHDGF